MFSYRLLKNIIVKFLQKHIDKFNENGWQTKVPKKFIYGEKKESMETNSNAIYFNRRPSSD